MFKAPLSLLALAMMASALSQANAMGDNNTQWQLVSEHSDVSFISIKQSQLVEVNRFNAVDAQLYSNGKFAFSVDLNSVDTGVALRDQRLQQFFFETDVLPTMFFEGRIDAKKLDQLAVGLSVTESVAGTLSLHGIKQSLTAELIVTRLSSKRFMIRSYKPLLLDIQQFELQQGLAMLKQLAGLSSISEKIPVSLNLEFERQQAAMVAQDSTPPAVTALRIKGAMAQHRVLQWSAVNGAVTHYIVKKRQANGAWKTLARVDANSTQWLDNADDKSLLAYKVIAVNNTAFGAASNVVLVDSRPDVVKGINVIKPLSDSHAERKYADKVYATASVLRSKLTDAQNSTSREAYLQFDLSDLIDADVGVEDMALIPTTLKLQYYLSGGRDKSASISVYVAEQSWKAATVNWNTRPQRGALIAQKTLTPAAFNENTDAVIDLSAAIADAVINGKKTLSLIITNASNIVLSIHAQEAAAALRPSLILDASALNKRDEQAMAKDNIVVTLPGDDNDGATGSNTGGGSGADTDTAADPDAIQRGEALWQQHNCSSCHGATGDGKPAGSSIIPALSSVGVKALITDTMPFGNPAACGSDCAEDVQAYVKFINGLSFTEDDREDDSALVIDHKPLNNAAQLKRLYKASMNLVSRLPTQQEMNVVNANGDEGFTTVLQALMKEPAFLARLREIYDPLLVDRMRTVSKSYFNVFGKNYDWPDEVYKDDRTLRNHARSERTLAVREEPLRLLEYIVKRNRPFTELLTADYTVMNYYSARAYNKHDQLQFKKLDAPKYEELPWDSEHFVKVNLDEIPLAGVLTGGQFMQKYPTTETNVNRHRSYTLFKLFLDTDILEISGTRTLADDIAIEHPTLNSPVCTGCHQVMDPVASSFRHWQRGADRRTEYKDARWDQSHILAPGFNGEIMPEEITAPLPWLAERVANDRRFAIATVKTLFTEITGAKLLADSEEDGSALSVQLYGHQKQQIETLADGFIVSGYQLKTLIQAMVMGDYFSSQDYLGGAARLLPVEQLQRKLLATTGEASFSGSNNYLNAGIYIGDQPSGVMTLIQRLMASSIACEAVAPDIALSANKRLLLPFFDDEKTVFDASGKINAAVLVDVKKNVQNLAWVFWGETLSESDEQIQQLADFYLSAVKQGVSSKSSNDISSTCRRDGIRRDSEYLIRGWIAMINMMIDDYRVLYL